MMGELEEWMGSGEGWRWRGGLEGELGTKLMVECGGGGDVWLWFWVVVG